jgi:deoxyribodipyrimidine photo-lyase
VIDSSYEALDEVARSSKRLLARAPAQRGAVDATEEPEVLSAPPTALGFTAPDASAAAGIDVWLVHAWSLSQRPPEVPKDAVCIAIAVAEFHQQNPWSALRWYFVGQRMADMASAHWFGKTEAICAALADARCVHVVEDLHLGTFEHHLLALAHRSHPKPLLFEPVGRLCRSFSGWWKQTRIAAHHHDSER